MMQLTEIVNIGLGANLGYTSEVAGVSTRLELREEVENMRVISLRVLFKKVRLYESIKGLT